jgi:hypothetical protein
MASNPENDNETNKVLYGGEWETFEGRSVPAGHAERVAAHEAAKRADAKAAADDAKRGR